MALRVLLADESSTIKRAIQMALSEYAVEVKSVQSGLDVLSVALTFKPDVVLADVLLTKKNGYDVCAELKANPATSQLPVILMWSSFLQIDRDLVDKVKANATLEKPFDTETLQAIIEKQVPKLARFPLHGLLNHPPLPDFTESDTFIRQKNSFQAETQPPAESADDAVDEFSFQKSGSQFPRDEYSLPEVSEDRPLFSEANQNISDHDNEWSTSSPSEFIVETENFGDFEEVTVVNAKKPLTTPDLQKRIQEQVHTYLQDSPMTKSKANETYSGAKSLSGFDEQLLREEIKQMAERICWQIIPDITEKVVRDELNKLLQGLEKNT